MTNVGDLERIAKKYAELKKSGNDAGLDLCVKELQELVHAKKSEIFSIHAGAP